MWNTSAAHGVCSACKYDPACIYEAGSGRVILQCEQFELGFPPPSAREPGTPEAASRASEAGENSARYAGLCVNCENRGTCIYPKPEGGIWRCEEYL